MAVSSSKNKIDAKYEEEEYSDDEEEDSSFNEDMETLRRAYMLSGTTPIQIDKFSATTTSALSDSYSDSEESTEFDDVELVRKIQQNLSSLNDNSEPVFLKPLKSLPPAGLSDSSDDEDDYETFRAIERRFASYTPSVLKKNTTNNELELQSRALDPVTTHISANSTDTNVSDESYLCSREACNSSVPVESFNDTSVWNQHFGSTDWYQSEASKVPTLSPKNSSIRKTNSSHFFIDAIKKNRSFQKIIRTKLILIEAKIEENKKLKERVKLLKNFQVSFNRRAGRALTQKRDVRIQLISARSCRKSHAIKVNDKKVSPLFFGPVENSQVSEYRMVMQRSLFSQHRKCWSDIERENIGKGIIQQFQEMLLQKSMEVYGDPNAISGDSNSFDDIITSITDFDIPPEKVRSFVPKVDWERLASLFVEGRSGAECETRWINHEDPLINDDPWMREEDIKLLFLIQQQGIHDWIDKSNQMGTNRTPFQCFSRYQRSLNTNILKRDWTAEDDAQLCAAVGAFGEHDWQRVASYMEGKAGTQCSNRWKKTLNPSRERVGRWTVEEDKYLKVAVMLFGRKTWNKIAQFIPGRTQVQCRERWINVLDPSLNLGRWTEEEDSRLKTAILEHGFCWSKVAEAIPSRTDNQCRRRWKFLFPDEVPKLQAARRLQKLALISNFVDREVERPALGPSDFLPLPTNAPIEADGHNMTSEKRKRRVKEISKNKQDTTLRDAATKNKSAQTRQSRTTRCPEQPLTSQEFSSSSQISCMRDGDDDYMTYPEVNTSIKKKKERRSYLEKKKIKNFGLRDQDDTIEGTGSISKRLSATGSCREQPLGKQDILLSSPTPSAIYGDDDHVIMSGADTTSKKSKGPKSCLGKKKRKDFELCDQEFPLSLDPSLVQNIDTIKEGDSDTMDEDSVIASFLQKIKRRRVRSLDKNSRSSKEKRNMTHQQNRPIKSKTEDATWSEGIPETLEDDVPLSSFLEKVKKRLKEDDVPLASLWNKKVRTG